MSVPQANEPSQPPDKAGQETTLWLLRAAKVVVVFVYAFVLVNLVLLTLGFLLRVFGASTDAEFTRWVYRNVDRIMDPFRGMFPSREISEQSVVDVSLLFAMIVYLMVGIALHALVVWVTGKLVAERRRQQLASVRGPQPGGPAGPGTASPGPAAHPAPRGPYGADVPGSW